MTDTDRLQSAKDRALAGITSEHTRRAYERSLSDFLAWLKSRVAHTLDKHTVETYLDDLATKGRFNKRGKNERGKGPLSATSINQTLASIRKLADVDDQFAIFKTVKTRKVGAKNRQSKTAKHVLTKRQAQKLLNAPNIATLKGLRDRALLAVLIGCGLKREEIASLTFEQIAKVQGQPAISLEGRTVPIPSWTKKALDAYTRKASSKRGQVFRKTSKAGDLLSEPLTEQFITKMVTAYSANALGIDTTPADLRRSFAALAYERGTPIDQIQSLLGHDSIQNTRLLLGVGSQLRAQASPGEHFGIKI